MITLRPYQIEANKSTREAWANGIRSQLVVMTMGMGKTEVFLSVLADELAAGLLSRALVIAHRKELIDQPSQRIARHWTHALPEPGIVMAGQNDVDAQIICATIQTLNADGRLDAILAHGPISHVIIDEAHHATAPSYTTIIDQLKAVNPALRVLGVTATPKRTDGDGLRKVFERVAFKAAIKDGISKYKALSPFVALGVQLPVDISKVQVVGDDYNAEQLGTVLDANNVLELVFETWQKHAADRPTMVFTASVAQAQHLADYFRSQDVSAAWASGETPKPERAQIISDFLDGKLQVIMNCLDARTEILTRRGWAGIDTIQSSDETASFDPASGQIKWESISRIVRRRRQPGERMVRITNQGIDIRVTEGHRMLIKRRDGQWSIVEAKELPAINVPYSLPLSGMAEPERIEVPPMPERHTKVGRRAATRYMLRQRGVADSEIEQTLDRHAQERKGRRYKAPHELTSAECEFIGLVITDGHIGADSRGVTISASDYYPNVQAEIERILDSCGFDWSVYTAKTTQTSYNKPTQYDQKRYRVPIGALGGELGKRGYLALEPYLDKDLSPLLAGLNREQTRSLVHGIWLGDGIKDGRKRTGETSWTIVSANPILNSRLQVLCVLRGLAANVSAERDNGPESTRPIFTVGIRDKTSLQTNNASIPTSGGNPASFEDGWLDEEVWCITNQTGTIVTRRNGKVAIMGQCALWTEGFDAPRTSCVAMVRPTRSDTVYLQAVGRGLRLSEGKTNCLILDFVPLGGRDLIMAGDLLGKPKAQVKREAKALEEGTISEAFGITADGLGIDGDPDDVIVRALDLFAQAPVQWTFDGQVSTAGIGNNLTVAIVSPQQKRLERAQQLREAGEWQPDWDALLEKLASYQVFAVNGTHIELGCAETWDDALALAGDYIDQHGDPTLARRTASWRHSPPSEKQIGLASRLGVLRPNMSRGQVAQAITHAFALQALRKAQVVK